MTKADWEDLYEILDNIHDDFKRDYYSMRSGSNQKIRRKAEDDVNKRIRLALRWIYRYPDLINLFTGENTEPFGKKIALDELENPNFFSRDMPDLLKNIKHKINSIE